MSIISSLQKRLKSRLPSRANASRKRSRSRQQVCSAESLELRQLLSATPIDGLSDEFDDAATQSDWQRVNEVEGWNADQLNVYDIDQTQSGRLVMQPHTVGWYQDWRGPMAFKEVTGDFVVTSEIHITDRDDIGGSDADNIPGDANFSLGGVMIRTPRDITNPAEDWAPGSRANDGTNNGENYVFLSFGYTTGGNQFSIEVKTTRNSNSQLEITGIGPDADTLTVQTARIGNSIITSILIPGQEWQVHRRYSRPDMPATLQVGLVTYSDWNKVDDFSPFEHNSNVLTDATVANPTPAQPYNPDLTVGFEYARFAYPDVPVALQGVDLTSAAVSDAQLLSFLGDNANIVPNTNPEIPVVSVVATDSSASEAGGAATFTFTRSGAPLDNALTIQFNLAGTAQAGVDYASPGNLIVIPAGQASASLTITPTDDSLIEGIETISLQVLDGALYDLGGATSALATIADDDLEAIGNQTVSHAVDVLIIDLLATLPDGSAITYEASLVEPPLYALDQQYDFYTNGNFYQNARGANERWIRGETNRWFFLLPDGELRRWDGSLVQSTAIAQLDIAVYEDPASLIDVVLPATVLVSGNQLSINPADGFVGSFEVDVTKANGAFSEVERITIDVTNTAPVIAPVSDQTMPYTQNELRIPFSVTDADGDLLATSIRTPSEYPWQVSVQHDFYTNGNFYENAHGLNERWIRGETNRWFFLLPDGELRRWEGSIDNTTLIADLDSSFYDNPLLLIEAEPFPVTLEIQGNEIVINPAADFVGTFLVEVTATDGVATTVETFEVSVVNAVPTIIPIPDQTMAVNQTTLDVALDFSDADGTPLTATVEVIDPGYQLDQTYGFWTNGNQYEDSHGLQEKWLRGQDNGWYYILSSGDMYRWGGSVATSVLIETLDTRYYADPTLLVDAEPLAVTAEIVGDTLTINRELSLTGLFRLRVVVSDGISAASLLLTVNIESN